jgi:hypothetical protein
VSQVVQWVRDLVVLALMGYLLELLLPGDSVRGYVRLVVGLVLLTALLTPILSWIRPGQALRLGLPGSAAAGVSAAVAAENRYALGEGKAILNLFAHEVCQAAQTAAQMPGVRAVRARCQVSEDPGSTYGQVREIWLGVQVLGAGASPSTLAQRVAHHVAGALGLAPQVVQVQVVGLVSRAGR